MPSVTSVLIIGAGQAGLALSWALTRRGIDHLLLERGSVGQRWQAERWPGLHLLTPNWMNRLPGPWPEAEPTGFMTAASFARRLDSYRAAIRAPVVTGSEVSSVTRDGDLFHVRTGGRLWLARAVVIATGACDRPAVPDWASAVPQEIAQICPSSYRGPETLQRAGVLVVGASATGVQLAAELQASGRPVTLAVGRHVPMPRRYRGHEIFSLLSGSGFLDAQRPADADPRHLMTLPSLQLTGADGGAALGLDRLAAMGVRLVGRALAIRDGLLWLDPDLKRECAAAARRCQRVLSHVDSDLARRGVVLTEPPEPSVAAAASHLPETGPARLDLAAEGIVSIVWATGFRRAYPWLQLPLFDNTGELMTQGGVTAVPGLYALGLPFMRHRASAFIHGAGRDAAALAPIIAAGLRRGAALAA